MRAVLGFLLVSHGESFLGRGAESFSDSVR
jgi:hypothetical protein